MNATQQGAAGEALGRRGAGSDGDGTIAAGFVALAAGLGVCGAALFFFMVFIIYQRIDRRFAWHGRPEPEPKKEVPPVMARDIKVPVVVMGPDKTFGVGYCLRHNSANPEQQQFSVLTLADGSQCGPLWRTPSMTLSDPQCTPRIGSHADAGAAVSPGSFCGLGGSSSGGGGMAVAAAVFGAGGAESWVPAPAPAGAAAAAAAAPKHRRRCSFDFSSLTHSKGVREQKGGLAACPAAPSVPEEPAAQPLPILEPQQQAQQQQPQQVSPPSPQEQQALPQPLPPPAQQRRPGHGRSKSATWAMLLHRAPPSDDASG